MNDAHANERGALAAAPGEDFYYASLYLPADARAAVNVIELTRREITRIPQSVSDRGVAHVKLAWWREEVERIARGEVRHDLARALVPLVHEDPALCEALATLVDATDATLLEVPPTDDSAVQAAVRAQQGAVFEAMQRRCGGGEVAGLAATAEIAFELAAFRLHRRGGLMYVSAARLAEHALDADTARHLSDGERARALLEPTMAALLERLRAGLGAWTRAERRERRLFVTLARIAARTLELTLEDGCRVLERRVAPTPVAKLAIAWRTRLFG